MSCDWDVYCKDCGEKCGIDNANHQQDLILDLIRNRHGLAAMAPVLNDLGMRLDLDRCITGIDPSWFAIHHDHRLAPISEYGDIVGDTCASCKQPSETRELVVDRVRLGLFCESCRESLVKILKEAIPP